MSERRRNRRLWRIGIVTGFLCLSGWLYAESERFPLHALEPFDPETPIRITGKTLILLARDADQAGQAMRAASYLESLPAASKPYWLIVIVLPESAMERSVTKRLLRRHFAGEVARQHVAFLNAPFSAQSRTIHVDRDGVVSRADAAYPIPFDKP